MTGLPRAFAPYLFAMMQSAITTGVASAIASHPFAAEGLFAGHWLRAWATSFAIMLPIVLLMAPALRRLADFLTGGADIRQSPPG